jgi:hypothetical protein
MSLLEFAATEYGREGKVVANEDVKAKISSIGINKCARASGFDRKNFIRKLIRDVPVKRNSYTEFVRWLENYKLQMIGPGVKRCPALPGSEFADHPVVGSIGYGLSFTRSPVCN